MQDSASQDESRFLPKCVECGKPVTTNHGTDSNPLCRPCYRSMSVMYSDADKKEHGLSNPSYHTLGKFYYAWAMFLTLSAIVLIIVGTNVREFEGINFLGLFLLAFAALPAITGWGLIEKKRWARSWAILLSVLALPTFPLGTALGIYGIWVCMSD